MEDMAFEAVVLRHPESFSPEAVSAFERQIAKTTGLNHFIKTVLVA